MMVARAPHPGLYGALFGDAEAARLFDDDAEVAAMQRVEAELAAAQGRAGVIPAESGAFLHHACTAARIPACDLAAGAAGDGVPVPALVAALRAAIGAPGQTDYLHWGATSQDIMDTALALRLAGLFDLWDARLGRLIAALGALAGRHAALGAPARTYGQLATPTSFGAVVAAWGWPLLEHRAALAALRPAVLRVSLSGAAGTLSVMGDKGPEVRAGLAAALGLQDPGHSWHADRSGIARLAGWMGALAGSLGKMGEDLLLLTQSGIGEVRLAGAGGSSTMPQKQNPVGPSALVALARLVIGLSPIVQGAALHRQMRDGAAWFTEWLTLPQACIATAAALARAEELAGQIAPDAAALARNLDDGTGLIHAEALSFALAERMPRPEAQVKVKALSREAVATGEPLAALAARDFPGTDWAERLVLAGLGQAPDEALAFCRIAGAAAPAIDAAISDRAGAYLSVSITKPENGRKT